MVVAAGAAVSQQVLLLLDELAAVPGLPHPHSPSLHGSAAENGGAGAGGGDDGGVAVCEGRDL